MFKDGQWTVKLSDLNLVFGLSSFERGGSPERPRQNLDPSAGIWEGTGKTVELIPRGQHCRQPHLPPGLHNMQMPRFM